MTPHYTVAEYMQSDVVSVTAKSTIREAVELMLKTNTNSLVVVDEQSRVVGMLSSIDVIHFVVPDYLEDDKHLAAFEARDVFAERVQEIGGQPVHKSMSANVHTIKSSHTLIEAATLLAEHRINQLPVVDDDGKLVGYIGRTNVKKAIGDVFAEHPA